MGLTLVATFLNLTEAQIAAGALRSGGLHADVADSHYGSLDWTRQFTLQGFRLTVPQSEIEDAVAFLSTLPEPVDIPDAATPDARYGWRLLGAILGLTLSPMIGWLAVGFRPRARALGPADWLGFAGAALLIATFAIAPYAFMVQTADEVGLVYFFGSIGLLPAAVFLVMVFGTPNRRKP